MSLDSHHFLDELEVYERNCRAHMGSPVLVFPGRAHVRRVLLGERPAVSIEGAQGCSTFIVEIDERASGSKMVCDMNDSDVCLIPFRHAPPCTTSLKRVGMPERSLPGSDAPKEACDTDRRRTPFVIGKLNGR